MKRILWAALLLMSSFSFAQNYPSPTFNNVTVNGTLTSNFKNLSCTQADTNGFNKTGADNKPALDAWISSLAGKSGCLSFGPGTYTFASSPAYTLAAGQTLTIKGAGSDTTEIEFTGSSNGLNITYTQSAPDNINGSSLNMGDMALTTDGTTAVNPLTITGNNTDNTHAKATYLWNLTARGHTSGKYWTAGFNFQNVYQVTMDNPQYQGQTGQGTAGYGILYNGPSSSAQGIVLNVYNSNIFNAGYGIQVTGYNQGINIIGGNIVDTGVGIACGNGAVVGSQCSVTGVQIAAVHNCITANHVSPVSIVGNVCTIGTWAGSSASDFAISLNNSTYSSISSNLVYIDTAGAGGVGSCIDVGQGNDAPASISNNSLINCTTVYNFNSNSSPISVVGNTPKTFTTYQTGLPASGSNVLMDAAGSANITIPGLNLASPPAIGGTTPNAGTFTNLTTTGGTISFGANRTASTGFELGGQSGTAASAYMDLHSSGNAIDYDSRIISTGGTASIGNGAIQYIANGGHTFTGALNASSVNLTGGTINSTSVGATTPSTGSFTTLSASSTVSGTGFSNYLASPPAIGGTTANTGRFTTLTATSTITPSSTAGIVGTTTNDNANAGSWGEYNSVTGTPTGLTSGSYVDLATQSLSAGDWDTQCVVNFNGSSLAASVWVVGVNTVTNTQPADPNLQFQTFSSGVLTGGTLMSPPVRELLASATTIRCGGRMDFASGTVTATGYLLYRRRR